MTRHWYLEWHAARLFYDGPASSEEYRRTQGCNDCSRCSHLFLRRFRHIASAQLSDDFTADSSLNSTLWTNSSGLLKSLAAKFNSSLVTPTLNFGMGGITVSGVNHSNELAGVQSLGTFQPPFTVTTTVTADEAHGNAYELFLVSPDLTQWINVAGNLNPGNGSFFGVWVNYDNSGITFVNLGETLYSDPSTNSQYTLQIYVENTGVTAVSLFSSSGELLGVLNNLNVGPGPFYLILGQREGGPYVPGPNIATWQNVSLIPSTPAPVLAPLSWANGTATLAWTSVAGATYQAQYTTSLSPAQWNDLGPSVTATSSSATVTDFSATDRQCFYRIVTLP